MTHKSPSSKRSGDTHVRRKREIRDTVRENFTRFGDRVCALVLREAITPGGLRRMVDRLDLQVPNRVEYQFEAIERFLNEHGEETFLKAFLTNPEPVRVKPMLRSQSVTTATDPPLRRSGLQHAHTGTGQPAPNQPATQPHWWDATGQYIGPERRRTPDRRIGQDRRGDIDAVSSNRRFGGDRRKNNGRRKDD